MLTLDVVVCRFGGPGTLSANPETLGKGDPKLRMDMSVVVPFLLGLGLGVAITLLALIAIVASRSWRRATFSGVPVPLLGIVGMRLRGTPPDIIVDAGVALAKRGAPVSWDSIEAVFLARGTSRTSGSELAALVENEQDLG
jgi:uncharacterized protein YqfA (UPF0365 family)